MSTRLVREITIFNLTQLISYEDGYPHWFDTNYQVAKRLVVVVTFEARTPNVDRKHQAVQKAFQSMCISK
eukprot:1394240-Amorphochlora_amoeboformis.AAC.1